MTVLRPPLRSVLRDPFREPTALYKGGGVSYDYYVDPLAGSDGNDGLSSATAKATLAAALTAAGATNKKVGVKSGATVVEANTVTFTSVQVGVYGGSSPFKLDVRQHLDSATWSLVSGTTNVYESSVVTHRQNRPAGAIADDSAHFGLWLDDTCLQWIAGGADIAANTSTVDATAGTFTVYKSGSTTQDPRLDTVGTDYVYRVHLPDSSDPTGKDVSIADRPAVFLGNGATISDMEFVGNIGKDAAGDNTNSPCAFNRVRGLDIPVHAWVGSPVSARNWGGTRRLTPGLNFSTVGRRGNLLNLYEGTNAQKALSTTVSLRNVGDGWETLIYGHTAGGQTDRIGDVLNIHGQEEVVDNVGSPLFMINGTNLLFSEINVNDLHVTGGARYGFRAGAALNVRNCSWESASLLTTPGLALFAIYGDTLVEDTEWEFLNPSNVSIRNWLIQRVNTATITFRRCLDRAYNTDRRGYMYRGTGYDAFTLVVEDSTLGNLMDQVSGANWPTGGVYAYNSTLGFGDRNQAAVEAALTTAGIPFEFENCTFLNLSGVPY